MINPQFVRSVGANLRYWLAQTADLSDALLDELDRERQSLLRAVQYGLKIGETAIAAAQLVAQLFELIERRGYWSEWIPIVAQARQACRQTSPTLALHLHNQQGFFLRLERELEASIACHQAVIAQARAQGERQEWAIACVYLGNAYYETHQYAEAQQVAAQALAMFPELTFKTQDKKIAAALNLSGLICYAQGEHETAVAMYHQAIAHWQRAGDHTYQARTLNNLGLALISLQRLDAALMTFDQAQEVLRSTVSELDKIKTEINRGFVYATQEAWALAEAAFRRANSPFLHQSGDTVQQAMVANNLGNVLAERENWDDARHYLKKSERLWREAKDEIMLANTLGKMGEIEAGLGNTAVAQQQYKEAIHLLQQHPGSAWAQQRLEELHQQYQTFWEEE